MKEKKKSEFGTIESEFHYAFANNNKYECNLMYESFDNHVIVVRITSYYTTTLSMTLDI